MAPIESKHDVPQGARCPGPSEPSRAKTLIRQLDVMGAFLVAGQTLRAVSEWKAERHAQVGWKPTDTAEQRLEGVGAEA